MTDALLPLDPEDELRRLRLQQSIDQDTKVPPAVSRERRTLTSGVPLRLRCQVCNHEWDLPWEQGMLVDVFVTRIRGYLVCPKCGNKSRARKKTILLVPRG